MKKLLLMCVCVALLGFVTVSAFAQDSDGDGVTDSLDNCPTDYNPGQEDSYPPGGNDCGDACECEGDFDGDQDLDGFDYSKFRIDFERTNCTIGNRCNGDLDCDGDVDLVDEQIFLEDSGRSILNPCPPCATDPWCTYDAPSTTTTFITTTILTTTILPSTTTTIITTTVPTTTIPPSTTTTISTTSITTTVPVPTTTTTTGGSGCQPDYPIDCGNDWCCPLTDPVCGYGPDVGLCFSGSGSTTTTIPVHTEAIPTLSEWGMIIFMTIIVGISIVVLSRRRMV